MTALGMGALLIPDYLSAKAVTPAQLQGLDTKAKKALADAALQEARKAGATYADVRIGRYLSQAIAARESRIQNISNNESYGVGIRVIVNGTWGFAATNEVTKEGIQSCARRAAALAKANARLQKEPVQLAPQKGLGERAWKTPIEVNAFAIPVQQKADLLLKVNSEAMKAGATYINSNLYLVNEQKYFASTDGSYIDQDIHRLWPTFSVTVVDKKTGKFKIGRA